MGEQFCTQYVLCIPHSFTILSHVSSSPYPELLVAIHYTQQVNAPHSHLSTMLPNSQKSKPPSQNQGTNTLEKLATSLLQHTHLSKLFIASVTLQSSHKLRHRQGHTIMLRGELWQTTHCGPVSPIPEAPRAQDVGWEEDVAFRNSRRVMIRCSRI